jgi:hypothetical protein
MRRLILLAALVTAGALLSAGCDGWGAPQVAPAHQAQDDVVPIPLDPERPRPAPPGPAETLRTPRAP